jgi:serine/threonine-protein kinase RsbW
MTASMPAEDIPQASSRLILQSSLDDMLQVWPWVEALAAEHAIPGDTLFAIHLCLEEALSNVIRHGYSGQPGHFIAIDFTRDRTNGLVFTVEDQAPAFDPLGHLPVDQTNLSTPVDRLRPGGHGIRLMRKFAASLGYKRLPNGNRLTIRFALHR